MCLLTYATGSSEGPGKVVEAQTFIKMLPNCCPMSPRRLLLKILNNLDCAMARKGKFGKSESDLNLFSSCQKKSIENVRH